MLVGVELRHHPLRCHQGIQPVYFSSMSDLTPLADFHRANGAVFSESSPIPAHFGDSAREYTAARDDAGLMDRSDRGLLQFTGPDRLPFLQGMLSNDLRI